MIDIHTHFYRPTVKDEPVFDESELLTAMDRLEIERAVILPLVSPECQFGPVFNSEFALAARDRHPDRFIPFCNLDPRNGFNSPETDFSWILETYKARGAKGVGEITANLPFDDPRCNNFFTHCGNASMPVLFHLAVGVQNGIYGLADELGLPRLERMLAACPHTIFIGHAMAFWSEISGNNSEEVRGIYPTGPVAPGGKLLALMQRYPNLYGDISAGSGFNAISRDPSFGFSFLEMFQDRLLFGTDLCHVKQEEPITGYLRNARDEGHISENAFAKITEGNAKKLLGV